MRTIYLDLFSGISGDMFLGALIDIGVDFGTLERELQKLGVHEYHLHCARGERGHIAGCKFDVHVGHHGHAHAHAHHHENEHRHEHDHSHHHHHPEHEPSHEHEHGRTFSEIKALVEKSKLSPWVKQKSIAVFQRIAAAEGKIHGLPPEKVHFHEVGAVDSIVDIMGACVALELLGKPRVLASPVVEGHGWVNCAHGRFPIPAPATLEILAARGVAVTQSDEPHELVTPTGAALLAEFAESFGPLRNFAPEKVGYGLGSRENKTRPNVLRALIGRAEASEHDWEADTIVALETNLDDINAELLGAFVDSAFRAGALDVFHTAIQMKKNRPGALLTVLCCSEEADRFSAMILRETTAFGVRRTTCDRRKLQRKVVQVKTSYGDVAVKLGYLDGKIVQIAPEFDSCRERAEGSGVSLKTVYEAAVRSAQF